MDDDFRIKADYTLARCCAPRPPDPIIGYYSHDNVLKVHRSGCQNLTKADPKRLLTLSWDDVLEDREPFKPDDDYTELDTVDFAVLAHHEHFGVDYAHVVARAVCISKDEAFERHRKLRDLGLLRRVEPTMIRYRKGIVDNKWIKHRNHTYYELTDKGRAYLAFSRRK
jgi:hypothetical protein